MTMTTLIEAVCWGLAVGMIGVFGACAASVLFKDDEATKPEKPATARQCPECKRMQALSKFHNGICIDCVTARDSLSVESESSGIKTAIPTEVIENG